MRKDDVRRALAMIGGAAVTLAVVIGWFVATPRLTLMGMRDAAARGDTAAFASYIDMDALRDQQRNRLTTALRRRPPAGRVRMKKGKVDDALAGPMIDRMFSVQGDEALLHPKRRTNRSDETRYGIVMIGPDRFEVGFSAPRHVVLAFQRHGLHWRLCSIEVQREEQAILA